MTKLIKKLFLKDREDRSAAGKFAGITGIVCNALLFVIKLIAGLLSGSVSVLADAVNNLSDASGSLVTLIGFRLAGKPADDDHPYGHARMEYLTGLGVAVLILVIGIELGKSSIGKIISPERVTFSWLTVGILTASVAVKLWLSVFYTDMGKTINSAALLASAADSRNDVISTLAVLAAGLLERFFGWRIDGVMGLAVAAFILYSGIGIVKQTVDPLLGAAPDPELVHALRESLLSYDRVLGIHDLMVHDYGPGRQFASVHVEMDSKQDVLEAHDLIDNMEREVGRKHHIGLTIHYDPIVTGDAELTHMRERVQTVISAIDPRLSLHDFRMVRGVEHTNLIFDLVIPFDLKEHKKELKQRIDEKVQFEDSKYYTVITFDDKAFNT